MKLDLLTITASELQRLLSDGKITSLGLNPSGSSTGSAVAVSAGFAPVSIGADFNGSLTNPAIRAALYTIRTTPGIVSEHRCFPFSKNRDSVGPMAKSVEDLVGLLNVVVDLSHSEVPDRGYNTSLSRDWKDISFGTLNPSHWRLPEAVQKPQPGALDQIIRETLAAYKKISTLAKRVVGPVNLISDETLDESMDDVLATIKNDFSTLFEAYTSGLNSPKVKTLAELINFNEHHRKIELPDYLLIQSLEDANSLTDAEHDRLDVKATASAADDAIDKTLLSHNVDVMIGPADSRLPDVVALAKYPSMTLPLGYLDWNGRPFGLLVVGSKYQEGLLLDVARLWEATFPPRKTPDLDCGGDSSGTVL
ncbi:hypothetical protein J4E89_010610 [Alternaria sp. Ai002NY15]|nr:hypothetical protein J4E89_010610 [Alternaria sp. Ai002NY15]